MLRQRMSKRNEHYAFKGVNPEYKELKPRIRTLVILSRYAYQMRDLEIREILKGEYLIL